MRIIGSTFHGMLDYLVGMSLIISPWALNFARGGSETWAPVALGTGAVIYSLMTRYELGIFKIISFRVHLMLDTLSGILLAVSPWLFGFAEFVYLPHLILGLMEVGVVLLSKTHLDDPAKADKFKHLTPVSHRH